MTKLINKDEVKIFNEVKSIIEESRTKVLSYVNTALLFTYWNIGKLIVEYQGGEEKAKYGDKLIENLSKMLTEEYGKGYNKANLKKMRKFYLCFKKGSTVSSQLSWSHYVLLIMVKDPKARDYYINEAIKGCWSTRELERQIKTSTYNRELSNQIEIGDNEDNTLLPTIIKDPYMLEFLGLKDKYLEKDLEDKIMEYLEKFLLELGKGYTFKARQKAIKIDNKTYYIDLVFYNSILKCYALIDLKIKKLNYNDLSQMDLYCNYFDKEIKNEDDNLTIGLILVKENDKIIIKYSSVVKNSNIFTSRYLDYIPSSEELNKIINEEKIIYLGSKKK